MTTRKKAARKRRKAAAVEATATELLLTVAEVAAMLSCSRMTVRRLLERGELPTVRLGPQTVRIARADVLDLIERQRRGD